MSFRDSAAPLQNPDTREAPEDARAVPSPGTARADAALQVRVDAATFQRGTPLPAHPDNGDEARYPSRFANNSKGLPHDAAGDVDTAEYDKLLAAVASGNPADFEAITLGGTRKLVDPQSGYAYQLEGADPQSLAIAPAPAFASLEVSGEMDELYWMALARDVAFQDYTAASLPPVITEALQRLNQLGVYRGARASGQVTAATLFRDTLPGSTVGPFISQFLLLDVPYGAQTVSQRIRTRVAGDDRVSTFAEWLRIQNGQLPSQPETNDSTPRYIRNGRDLAEFVHHDFPLQSSLNAALLIASQNDNDTDGKSSPPVHDENNPYRQYLKQDAFATFGNADGQDLIGRIMKLALQGIWFQKWSVHRRQRPEEFGGRVHNTKAGTRAYPVNAELLGSPVLQKMFDRNQALNGGTGGTYLLAQAFPEGSPVHPAYGSGHSTYMGAGVTMLKAFFKTDLPVKNPVVPSADGLSLVPYSGAALTIENELDKLAMNVGVGRLFGGVHWRSDHEHAVRLGELISLRVLQDLARTYNEDFAGFQVRTFGGNVLTIGATTPELPNHVSSVTGFCIVDANGQPVPGYEELKNGMVLRLGELPAGWKLRVNTFPATVGSVRTVIDGGTWHDNSAPYTVDPAALTPGSHTLMATPYSGSDGSGLGGVPLFLRIQVDGHWARTGSLKEGRMNHCAVLLGSGKVLMGPTWGASKTELYDPTTGQWSYTTGAAKHYRTWYTATRLMNGKVLVAGGAVGTVKPVETELYDPATGTWTVNGSLDEGRHGHTATLLQDGRVLLVGGYGTNGYGKVEVYDPATNAWSILAGRQPQADHTATLLKNGKVLLVGGNTNTALAFLFDPTTNTLSSITPPGEPLMLHTATRLDDLEGRVLVGGGSGHSWLYSPDSGSWTFVAGQWTTNGYHTATLLLDGRVLLTGGEGPNGLLRDAELFDPVTNTWTTTSPMFETRRGHTATLLADGRVLVAGSNGYGSPDGTCELYTPTP
ncbi:kelch repeat-containing protein [Pyxidicoccus caerfyrddinensis]|uniref:kelch repeat-containing protein n=1 Tax=Pyxidicoccus caerfyrddinensis TaxID=2709663 RepID=UPI0013D95A8C|nr:kelch repeat-containing protein [Pyxidicoccus caerfyrddinensis]